MKKILRKFHMSSIAILLFALSADAQVCEWQLINPTYSAVDPDGAGPATGSATFTLQIHTTSGVINNVNAISLGWSYQSASAMIPTSPGCAIVTNPANVTISPAFVTGGFSYNVNQCGVFNQTAGSQNFDRRTSGTLDGTSINLTTTWVDVFTVTLWALGSSNPEAGYVVINSGVGGSPAPFLTYEVADAAAMGYTVNSLTYNTPLQLGSAPLPVLFSSYDVKCSDKGASLVWSTETEVNSSHFEIQKSINGNEWTGIAKISSSGNSSSHKNYQYLDLEGGKAFYRIRQVDIDGHDVYTAVKTTACNNRAVSVTVYPTPAKNKVTVALNTDRNFKTDLQILDASGRIVYKQSAVINKGVNNIQMDVRTLAAGEYILVSSDPSIIINKKIIISR